MANIRQGSIGFYVLAGLLEPSTRFGEGTGHSRLFGMRDLIIASTIAKMRLPGLSAEGMRKLAAYWRSLDDDNLRATALVKVDVESAKSSTEKILVLLDNGSLVVEDNLPILVLTRKYGSSVVHVVDAGQLANQALVDVTEDHLVEPLASGRLPRRPRPASAVLPESRRRRERPARIEKTKAKKKRGKIR
jgi:hypothetical protein